MTTARDITARHAAWTEWLETNDGETFTLVKEADVEPVIDHNKRLQTHNPAGMGITREWKHVAEIPMIVVEQWIKQYGVDPTDGHHPDLLRRLLNDPDWRWLRTSEGRVF